MKSNCKANKKKDPNEIRIVDEENNEIYILKRHLPYGFLAIKAEYLLELSLSAQGLYTRMINDPNADYINAENIFELSPADKKSEMINFIHELVDKGYILKSKSNEFAINKIKLVEVTHWIAPNCQIKEV